MLLPLGANLFLQRWKLSVSTKPLTHSQWRCQFSGPRHCGLDNLIGEARRCVPGRGIQTLYHRLSQCWLLSCCKDPRFNSPYFWSTPIPPASVDAGGGQHRPKPLREPFVGRLTQAARLQSLGEVQGQEPAAPLPGSRLGGRHEISRQMMKLSLFAGERGKAGLESGGGAPVRGGLHRA